MKRILPLILTAMLLFTACTKPASTQTASPLVEPTSNAAELPSDPEKVGAEETIEPQDIEPTPVQSQDEAPEAQNSASQPASVEPIPEEADDEASRTQSTPASEPTLETQRPPSSTTPSATLEIIVPATAPEPTPTLTEQPAKTPTPAPETPQPTETPAIQLPQPEQTDAPSGGYTDATNLQSAFMDAINTEKAANGAVAGSLSSGLCSIAQDRARQMAEACQASHIGSGYPETVGAMGSSGGVTNRGRNAVHHSPQLMDCTSFGVGVAIGSDGMYYYSIIGQ